MLWVELMVWVQPAIKSIFTQCLDKSKTVICIYELNRQVQASTQKNYKLKWILNSYIMRENKYKMQ